MKAVYLKGHGGPEMLEYRTDAPEPQPAADEVLIRVAASSVNNTDINTRTGWYAGGVGSAEEGGSWGGSALTFPLIQGTDIVGRIVGVGANISRDRIGERVLVQPCLVSRMEYGISPWVASETNGGYAEFAVAPAADSHPVDWGLSDFEMAALPCAYGTASNMLEQAKVGPEDRVLVSGASGNVGIAAILLARLLHAEVHVVSSPEKWEALKALGVAACYGRDLSGAPSGRDGFHAIIDLVGGENWTSLLDRLQPHGRLVISGAIGGAEARLDLRKLYLNNWTILGRTQQTRSSFQALIGHVNSGKLHPPIHRIYPLEQLAEAQAEFEARRHIGKIIIDTRS